MASIKAASERQPQAEPRGAGIAQSLERHEHPVPVGHRDTGAGVDDPQLHAPAGGVGGEQRRVRGVALSVDHQVDDHPLEQAGVDHDVR